MQAIRRALPWAMGHPHLVYNCLNASTNAEFGPVGSADLAYLPNASKQFEFCIVGMAADQYTPPIRAFIFHVDESLHYPFPPTLPAPHVRRQIQKVQSTTVPRAPERLTTAREPLGPTSRSALRFEVPDWHVRTETVVVNYVFDQWESHRGDLAPIEHVLRLAVDNNTLWCCEHGCHRSTFGLASCLVALGGEGA